jgi:hypothetical protein
VGFLASKVQTHANFSLIAASGRDKQPSHQRYRIINLSRFPSLLNLISQFLISQ